MARVPLRSLLIGGSLFAHGALVGVLGLIRAPVAHDATAIEVTESVKKEPPPPARVDPTPPEPAPETPRARARPAAAAPVPAPEPAVAKTPGLSDLPELGLEMSGGTGGGGLAVPPPAAAPRASAAPVEKTFAKAAPAPKPIDTCDEGPAKPKLLKLPQPAYTEAARAAGVEGKVRVELTVDETGKVASVRALTTLGHGLDEAALAAARAATFEPAIRCGKPSRSTFTIAIRFSAS
jgi:periplasmic protein TonB